MSSATGVSYFVTFLISITVAAPLTLLVRQLANRYGWFDRNGKGKKSVPRLGGLAIVGGFYAALFAVLQFDSVGDSPLGSVWGLLLGGAAIALLGLYDDLKGANAPVKLLVQVGVALALYAAGFRIENLTNPFGAALVLGAFSLPLTVLWVVGDWTAWPGASPSSPSRPIRSSRRGDECSFVDAWAMRKRIRPSSWLRARAP